MTKLSSSSRCCTMPACARVTISQGSGSLPLGETASRWNSASMKLALWVAASQQGGGDALAHHVGDDHVQKWSVVLVEGVEVAVDLLRGDASAPARCAARGRRPGGGRAGASAGSCSRSSTSRSRCRLIACLPGQGRSARARLKCRAPGQRKWRCIVTPNARSLASSLSSATSSGPLGCRTPPSKSVRCAEGGRSPSINVVCSTQ